MNNVLLEKRTVRKVTWRLVPFLAVLFFIACLDRSNVSFAALSMNKDLGFSSAMYGFGAGIFFIGYFLMEVPGNLLLSKICAQIWIMRILVMWWIITALSALFLAPIQCY